MKLEKIRNWRRCSRWVEGIFSKNPVLVCGLALPFAVMITNNLKNSASISILLACSLIPTVLLATLIGKYMANWVSVILYALFSMVLVISVVPLIAPISPEITDALGIYIPILSVNTVTLTLCNRYTQDTAHPVMALVDAITYSLGFALAMGMIALVRELLGNNTLWGNPINLPFKISGLQIAFSGFILAAFFSALFRFVKRLFLGGLYRHYNPPMEDSSLL